MKNNIDQFRVFLFLASLVILSQFSGWEKDLIAVLLLVLVFALKMFGKKKGIVIGASNVHLSNPT